MQLNLKTFLVVALSALLGAITALRFNNSEVQGQSSKESRFVLTATLVTNSGARFFRFEDTEYNIVCYAGGTVFSCAKK